MADDVYEQVLTLDGVLEHRNLCAFLDFREPSILRCSTSEARFSANFGRENEIFSLTTHHKPQEEGKVAGW